VPRAPFTIDAGRLRIDDAVLVYLERAVAPPGPLAPGAVPRAHGLAPASVSDEGTVVAAVAEGEAVWLGFQAVDPERPVTLRVRVEGEPPLDAVTGEPWRDERDGSSAPGRIVCPPENRLAGVRRADGTHAFGTGVELAVIAWIPEPAEVAVQLVRPERFTDLTGEVPEPLDRGSAYGGWRLP
jgi:hypothetical protein